MKSAWRRRRAIFQMGAGVARSAKTVDRLFLPIVAGTALFTMLAAVFHKQVLEFLNPPKPGEEQQGPRADVTAILVNKVPDMDPDSPIWDNVPLSRISLADQSITKPLKLAVPEEPVKVRAAHDGEVIGFLLEWSDKRADTQAIKVTEFRDACAVMVTSYPAPPEARFMGTQTMPATILHWKADWQVDIEEGFQDLEKAFPNISVDMYPLLKESITGGKPPKTIDLPDFARIRLAGTWVGNPISQPKKDTPVEKIIAKGPATIATLPTQDAVGWGRWRNGVWRVVLAKKMKASDQSAGEADIERGKTYSVAFTVWFGDEGDRGARKNPSMLHTLYIE
ncbi:MAG: ethylbenzene dehydrogenase-related protein [Nitrososphaerota archaeon]